MPTIKLTTGGSVVLKGGKPSCTCCGPCSPNATTVYIEYNNDPLGSPVVTYFEMTGSLNTGYFAGAGPNGTCTLEWLEIGEYWQFICAGNGEGFGGPTPVRCNPGDDTYREATDLYEAIASLTPLP